MSKDMAWIAVIVIVFSGHPGIAAFLGVIILLS